MNTLTYFEVGCVLVAFVRFSPNPVRIVRFQLRKPTKQRQANHYCVGNGYVGQIWFKREENLAHSECLHWCVSEQRGARVCGGWPIYQPREYCGY